MNRLLWDDGAGIGFYPVRTAPYDDAYFAKYQGYADTSMGRALTAARVAFVSDLWTGPLADVGIGCGAFIQARRRECAATWGYDVNPAGVRWLNEHGLWMDPYRGIDAVSLWDVLEHIVDYWSLIDRVRRFVFVSIPVFEDRAHVLRSKHFRMDEHYWYFTEPGLLGAFKDMGFRLVKTSRFESQLGREDIGSYAFERVDA